MGLTSSVYRSGPVPRWWLQEQEKYELFEPVFKLLNFLARTCWEFTQFRIRACYSSQIMTIKWLYSIASFFELSTLESVPWIRMRFADRV